MIKTFFIVVPYEVIRLPTQKETAETYRKNLEQLNQRVDEVTIGLQRISLLALPLKTDELTELFYNFYNPQLIERKKTVGTQEKNNA